MEEKIIDIEVERTEKRSVKERIRDGWDTVKKKARDARDYVVENAPAIATIGVVTVAIGKEIVNCYAATHTEAQLAERRSKYSVYDPRTGIRWELKRQLSGYEKMELEDIIRSGGDVGDYLESIRALKR